MFVKLDLAKEFVKVNYNFVCDILCKFRFNPSWVNWVDGCISTTSFVELINGRAIDFFKSFRGSCQG
jgi:hypothetical protein